MKKYILHDGKNIEIYTIGNSKSVLIMLGGWTHDFQYEEKLIKQLAIDNTVITISYPGYSNSQENPKAQSIKYLSTIISTVVNSLNLKQYILVGFSMGCQIVLQYIQDHPKQKAVLISPIMHTLRNDTPLYGRLILSSHILLWCIRFITPIKRLMINIAYAKISNVTEGQSKPSEFQNTHVSLNGAYDTLIATINTFIDPIDFKENVRFIFGDHEIMQKRLDMHKIPYKLIHNTGHETFEKNYKQVATLIS